LQKKAKSIITAPKAQTHDHPPTTGNAHTKRKEKEKMRENTTKTTGERRFLTSWKYNAARILTELENIVKNNGGTLCTTWQYSTPPEWLTKRKKYLIINRTLEETIEKEKTLLQRLEKLGKTDAARETQNKLDGLCLIDNAPRISYYADYLYIQFSLEGYFYYFSMDDNPFFDFHFARVKIEEGEKINQNYYLQNDNKKWLYDCFFFADCAEADTREAANLIFNMLLTADTCRTYTDKKRGKYTSIFNLEG
jgi:hypothetical protein